MKTLAIDTASGRLSLALAEEGGRLWRSSVPVRGDHDARITGLMDKLLLKAKWKLGDIGVLAAASGPGSFTGIRVGMTFVSILAASLEKPAVAVSLLEAEAHRARRKAAAEGAGIIAAAYPGVREEYFFQAFRSRRGGLEPVAGPRWAAWSDWPDAFRKDAGKGRTLLAGPAAEDAKNRLGKSGLDVLAWQGPPISAADLVGPALDKLRHGKPEFSPLYLKPAYYERSKNPAGRG